MTFRSKARHADRPTGLYESSPHPRWNVVAIVAFITAASAYVFLTMSAASVRKHRDEPLAVNLLSTESPPPAPPRRAQEPAPKPAVTAPMPRVVIRPLTEASAPVEAPVSPAPMPPKPDSPSEPGPQPVAKPAIIAGDLATRLISADPPRYPVESRRKREVGTVVLTVVVGEDGRVEAISVQQGSGFDRLDRAALSAVKRWRWSQTIVDGHSVKVRGVVRIPFELRS